MATKKKVEKKAVKAAPKKAASPAKKAAASSGNNKIKKQYLKSADTCKVTFKLPKEAAHEATTVAVVGDFNEWRMAGTPMKKLKTGDFTVIIELKPGREYRFRYLIDGVRWENDWCADRYDKNPYGEDDSIVEV